MSIETARGYAAFGHTTPSKPRYPAVRAGE